MIYAGIGARKTPLDVLTKMEMIARLLAMGKHTLNSGGASGADQAFECGARAMGGAVNTYVALNAERNPEWFNHARKYHPAWHGLPRYVQSLHARNSAILLGPRLDSPVAFVCCWTPGGAVVGGTGQGLRIAADYGIPVFNLAHADAEGWLWSHVK